MELDQVYEGSKTGRNKRKLYTEWHRSHTLILQSLEKQDKINLVRQGESFKNNRITHPEDF